MGLFERLRETDMEFMKEIERLIQRYADAIHTQDEKEFKSLWTREDTNILI